MAEGTTDKERDAIEDSQITLGVALFEKFRRNAMALGIKLGDKGEGVMEIDGPTIDKLISMDMRDVKALEEINYKASLDYKHGGYVNVDRDSEHQQHRMVRSLIKEVGQQLFQGSGLMFVSLPLYVFEPQSLLARLPRSLGYTELLSLGRDRSKRTECVTAFAVSCLMEMVSFRKPFTPRDGETLEASLGSCGVTAELVYPHIGKAPPVVLLLVRGVGWTLSARLSFTVKTSPRTLVGNINGAFEVNYSDGGKVAWTFPPWKISGITTGTLWIRYKDSLTVNNSNGETCELAFTHKRFRHFRGAGSPVDVFTGAIYNAPEGQAQRRELHKVSGRWLVDFQCDGRRLWQHGMARDEMKYAPLGKCLSSDWRLREDVRLLACGYGKLALDKKRALEITQRHDRAARAEAKQ